MMETKKGRHGGARPGAGRKPKGWRSPSALEPIQILEEISPDSCRADIGARNAAAAAVESVRHVMLTSKADSSKVSAAAAILDRAFGKATAGVALDRFLLLDRVLGSREIDPVTVRARALATLAIATLSSIAEKSSCDNARIAAAKVILDRALGKPLPSSDLGKKVAAKTGAASAGDGTEWGDDLIPPRLRNN